MINKSINKLAFLKLHNYFIKNWKNQNMLNYEQIIQINFMT